MGIATAIKTAVSANPIGAVLGGASAVSNLLGQRQARKQAETANEMSAQLYQQRRGDIEGAFSQAMPLIPKAYQAQRDVMLGLQGTIPGYLQQSALPQFELVEKGSRLGQDTIRGGMMAQIAALRGTPIDYSFAETKTPEFDYRSAVEQSAFPQIDLSAIDNAMALQGQSIPLEQLPTNQGWSRNLTPDQLAGLSPEQIQMIQQFNLAGDVMSRAASGSYI
ncbi:MAG: hypothetical protein VW907_00795 [Opitutae bacterium]